MATLPKENPVKAAIESGEVPLDFRPYIGMSSLLGECPRNVWYNFRWCYDRTVLPRIMRIFKRGDLEEARVISDLTKAGMVVTESLHDQTELSDETCHIKGHPDGKVVGVPGNEKIPHLLEIKTMKQSMFTKYKKEGLKKSHPAYWGQAHTYMGEHDLTYCLFIVTNKDTEERDYQIIEYDPSVHKECMSIAHDILTSEFPPKRIGDATWFVCKYCANKKICHFNEPIKKTCRSCDHVDIEMNGNWHCRKHDINLSEQAQMDGCKDYELCEDFKECLK